MSLVIIDSDPWLVEYELAEKLEKDILDLLNKRSVELKISDTYARLSSSIRIRLKQFEDEVQQLVEKLREATMSRSITLDESERRERLIEQLRTKNIQLQRRFNDRDAMSRINRSVLFDNQYNFSSHNKPSSSRTAADWASAENDPLLPENPSALDVEQLKAEQKRIEREQDKGLDELSKIISRQKDIAVNISTETEEQNRIIDDISSRMEKTGSGLRDGIEHINVVSMRDATCGYWVIIILLFCAIIVVIAL